MGHRGSDVGTGKNSQEGGKGAGEQGTEGAPTLPQHPTDWEKGRTLGGDGGQSRGAMGGRRGPPTCTGEGRLAAAGLGWALKALPICSVSRCWLISPMSIRPPGSPPQPATPGRGTLESQSHRVVWVGTAL